MMIYAWLLTGVFLIAGRVLHQAMRNWMRRRGVGQDRLLVVGTGDVARLTLQRILWSPQLGYEVVGIVDVGSGMGAPRQSNVQFAPLTGTDDMMLMMSSMDDDYSSQQQLLW